MHYVHFVESFSTGVFTWIQDVSGHQISAGHDVTIVFSIREETPRNWEALFAEGVQFIHMQMCREISPLDDLKAVIKFRKLLKQLKPDAVHLHSSKAGVIGRLAASSLLDRPAVFYTPHGLSFLRKDISQRKRALYQWFEKISGWMPGRVLACSESERLALSAVVSSSRLTRVNNAIDCDALDRVNSAAAATQPDCRSAVVTVCTLGGIRYQKAPWLFADIVRKIKREHPHLSMDWVWIGDGNPPYLDDLTSAGVRITGWIPREEALELLAGCQVYLQTSLWEGLPLSVLEAQYLGLPAVATDCGGNNDIILHGETGALVNTVDDFVNALVRLAQDPQLRQAQGEKARHHVRESFNLWKMLGQLDEVYESDIRRAKEARMFGCRVLN